MRDFHVLSFGQYEAESIMRLEALPTVCVLMTRGVVNSVAIEKIVLACTSIGSVFFVCCGNAADRMEYEVDHILENISVGGILIPTTSHSQESDEKIANFVVNSCHLENQFFRCLVVFDGVRDTEIDGLVGEVELQALERGLS